MALITKGGVNTLFTQALGRGATQAELNYWTNKERGLLTGALLKTKGVTKAFVSAWGPKTNKQADNTGNTGTGTDTTTTTTNAATKYAGTGGQFGELPKRDKNGKYAWYDQTGKLVTQEGYDSSSGSWDYLGEHTPFEWTAAQTLYKNSPPPPADFKDLTQEQQAEFISQAHQELSQNFLQAVRSGQTDLIYELGQAVDAFGRTLSNNNIGTSDDVRAAQNAMEAAGLTFSGDSKRVLGEGFSGAGKLTPEQITALQNNVAQITGLPGTATAGGAASADIPMPQPPEITSGVATSEEQKQAAWENFYKTDTWKQYQDAVQARAVSGTGNGVAGTGQYGFSGNLDPYAGTGITSAAGQGSIFQNAQGTGRTQLAESYRRTYNSRARELGMAAENLLGSSNISSLNLPSIGGQRSVTAAPNVLGSTQSGYQTNTATRGNELFGKYFGNLGYTFKV